MMNDKKYLIDDEPASGYDIIKLAREIDNEFGQDGLCQTSVAAGILRRGGYQVGNNPEWEEATDEKEC